MCKTLRNIVTSTPRLQYAVELSLCQMVAVDPPSRMSINAQRKLLAQREARWRALRWEKIHTLPIPRGGPIYEFVGGIYCNALGVVDERRASSAISFYQLPSTAADQGDRVRSWTLSVSGMDVIDFSIDPSQDLLVLVAVAPAESVHLLPSRSCD